MSGSAPHPEPDVIDEPGTVNPSEIDLMGDVGLDITLQPVRLMDKLREVGLILPQVDAKELVDHEITIFRMRIFKSRFAGVDHCYFCDLVETETGNKYSTVLGGQAVVRVLDAVVKAGVKNPITAVLRFNPGGEFNGYYYLD